MLRVGLNSNSEGLLKLEEEKREEEEGKEEDQKSLIGQKGSQRFVLKREFCGACGACCGACCFLVG